MAKEQVFGVLLPTTAYVLRIQPPPARKLIDQGIFFAGGFIDMFVIILEGVPVALGSDFNPNAVCSRRSRIA